MTRAVVVTEVGLVTGAGGGVESTFAALAKGAGSAARAAGSRFVTSTVPDAALTWPEGPVWRDRMRYAGRAARLAVAAAMPIAGVLPAERAGRHGVLVAVEPDASEWPPVIDLVSRTEDPRSVALRLYDDLPDFNVLRAIPASTAHLLAMLGPFEGGAAAMPRPTVGGLTALGLAWRHIAYGELDAVLVAGADPLPLESALVWLDRHDPLATEWGPGRGPFDASRAGGLVGEAGVALLVEAADTARERGATPVLRLIASETRAAGAAEDALADAVRAMAPAAPDAIWTTAFGSPARDAAYTRALARYPRTPVTTAAGCVGHASGGAALAAVALAARSARQGLLPPVTMLDRVDPSFEGIDVVAGGARPWAGQRVLIAALAEPPLELGGAVWLELPYGGSS